MKVELPDQLKEHGKYEKPRTWLHGMKKAASEWQTTTHNINDGYVQKRLGSTHEVLP